jgi:hypothetical protein
LQAPELDVIPGTFILENLKMPWQPKDAPRHDKAADTPKLQRQWSDIADGVLKRTGDEGRAIREANAVIRRHEGEVKHTG